MYMAKGYRVWVSLYTINWESLWYKYRLFFYLGLYMYLYVSDAHSSMHNHMSLEQDDMLPKRIGQWRTLSS